MNTHFKTIITLALLIMVSSSLYGETPNERLIKAVADGNYSRAREAIKEGADVNAQSQSTKFSALMIATQKGNLKIMNLLLNKKAKIDFKIPGPYNHNALVIAVVNRQFEALKLLLKRGANINAAINVKGGKERRVNALMFAIHGNLNEMAKFLIAQGIDIHAGTSNRSTALHFAAVKNNLEIAELLLKKGAKVGKSNTEGHTPLSIAQELKHDKMVTILEKYMYR